MKKIAAITGETADFIMTGGCTPCECGDTVACLQESVPLLEGVPTIVLNSLILYGQQLLLLLVPTIFFMLCSMIFRKYVSDINRRFITTALGNTGAFLLYAPHSFFEPEYMVTLIFAQLTIGGIFFFGPIKNKKISFGVFAIKYSGIILAFFLLLALVQNYS